jgi:hypothetical protein
MSNFLSTSAAATAALKPAKPAPTMSMSWLYFSMSFTFVGENTLSLCCWLYSFSSFAACAMLLLTVSLLYKAFIFLR